MTGPPEEPDRAALHKALSHPLRVRILLALQRLGSCSPIQFSRSTRGTADEVDVNLVAYHFRFLEGCAAIELSDKVPRRGATEHIFRITPGSPVLDLLRAGELLAAVEAWSPDRDPGEDKGPVSITPVDVDQQGRAELDRLLDGMRASLRELTSTCRRRLAESNAQPIAIRIGLATFQPGSNVSPPPVGS